MTCQEVHDCHLDNVTSGRASNCPRTALEQPWHCAGFVPSLVVAHACIVGVQGPILDGCSQGRVVQSCHCALHALPPQVTLPMPLLLALGIAGLPKESSWLKSKIRHSFSSVRKPSSAGVPLGFCRGDGSCAGADVCFSLCCWAPAMMLLLLSEISSRFLSIADCQLCSSAVFTPLEHSAQAGTGWGLASWLQDTALVGSREVYWQSVGCGTPLGVLCCALREPQTQAVLWPGAVR